MKIIIKLFFFYTSLSKWLNSAGKNEWKLRVMVTILIANADNPAWWPTLWRRSKMFFGAPLRGPGIVMGETSAPAVNSRGFINCRRREERNCLVRERMTAALKWWLPRHILPGKEKLGPIGTARHFDKLVLFTGMRVERFVCRVSFENISFPFLSLKYHGYSINDGGSNSEFNSLCQKWMWF